MILGVLAYRRSAWNLAEKSSVLTLISPVIPRLGLCPLGWLLVVQLPRMGSLFLKSVTGRLTMRDFILFLSVYSEKHVVIETMAPVVMMLAEVEINLRSFR